MDIDPAKIYVTPFIMGPLFDRTNPPGIVLADAELLILRYRTDSEAVRNLLPDCYELAEDPVASVTLADFGSVDFLAGNPFRQASVKIAVRYHGREVQLEGDYVLVAFENATLPIIMGREHAGMPTVYGDISPMKALGGNRHRCEASLWGHMLFGLEVETPSCLSADACKDAGKSFTERPTFGYKFFQSLDGQIDADYPTVLWADFGIDRLWLGAEGNLYFGGPAEDDIGEFKPVTDALRSLPVREVAQALRMQGSVVLRYDKVRRLR